MSSISSSNGTTTQSQFVGIGDLHLDGRLQKYLPPGVDLNEYIIDEVRLVLTKALKNGVRLAVFYGDIGDKPHLSYRAHMLLIDLIREFADTFKFLFLMGNHDFLNREVTGLDLLVHMRLPNAKFVTKTPKVFFSDSDHPLMLHPWPHYKDVMFDGACNVLHIETKGSMMDSGRASPTDVTIDPKAFWVAGHLHTNHMNYSGTIYQTSFGEKPEKFFHIVDRVNRKIKSVPHKPKYTLANVVIETAEDLRTLIPSDPTTLVKLFIKSKVVVPPELLDKYPNVVKHNSFQTKQELQALVMEDFVIDDVSGSANFDVDIALTDWLDSEKVEPSLRKRVLRLNKEMMSNTKGSDTDNKTQKERETEYG